jgi:transcriptional regulator with XRE-family HTH domain
LRFIGFSCLTHACITDNFALTNTKKMDNSSIKDNIRKVRKARKLTQEELADRLDISLTAYRDLEKGNTNIVNSNVIRLAELLGTTTEELVLGYRPVQAPGQLLEDVRTEYGGKIQTMERRIADLEKLVRSLEETIATKNEIIALLKNSRPKEN